MHLQILGCDFECSNPAQKSLNDAFRYAVDIEAFCRAELQRRGDVGYARKRNFSFKCH